MGAMVHYEPSQQFAPWHLQSGRSADEDPSGVSHAIHLRWLLFAAAAIGSPSAWAYCEGGRYPNVTVSQELRSTPLVVVGSVVNRMIVVDPIEDPAGYEAEIFSVRIERVVHGALPAGVKPGFTMSVRNENTSARFPMNVGMRYLLFVSHDFGEIWINSCGNSVDMARADPVMKQIRRVKGRR